MWRQPPCVFWVLADPDDSPKACSWSQGVHTTKRPSSRGAPSSHHEAWMVVVCGMLGYGVSFWKGPHPHEYPFGEASPKEGVSSPRKRRKPITHPGIQSTTLQRRVSANDSASQESSEKLNSQTKEGGTLNTTTGPRASCSGVKLIWGCFL